MGGLLVLLLHLFKSFNLFGMKKALIIAILLYSMIGSARAQYITDSTFLVNFLLDGIQNSTYIVEAEVVSQESYFNDEQTVIYTSNLIEVFQVWKNEGEVSFSEGGLVEVITRGGEVDGHFTYVTHALSYLKVIEECFFSNPALILQTLIV